MTAQTYPLVAGYAHGEDHGLVRLKGASAPVRVYRITGEQGIRTRIEVARERGFTRLVGRDQELGQLWHCYELANNGSGQAVSIIGEAGLGKSRLLYEFRHMLGGDEGTW